MLLGACYGLGAAAIMVSIITLLKERRRPAPDNAATPLPACYPESLLAV